MNHFSPHVPLGPLTGPVRPVWHGHSAVRSAFGVGIAVVLVIDGVRRCEPVALRRRPGLPCLDRRRSVRAAVVAFTG
jgi:hypothetical protein